jgi:archaellum component FlaC
LDKIKGCNNNIMFMYNAINNHLNSSSTLDSSGRVIIKTTQDKVNTYMFNISSSIYNLNDIELLKALLTITGDNYAEKETEINNMKNDIKIIKDDVCNLRQEVAVLTKINLAQNDSIEQIKENQ